VDRHNGQGNLASAVLRALAESLAIDEATYGPDHEQVAVDLNKLGLMLHGVGRLNEAKAHFERAMAIHERLFGPYHSEVATDLHYLGAVVNALGDLGAAKSNYERALAIDEASYGRSHPRVRTDLERLQAVQREMGETPIEDIFAQSTVELVPAFEESGHPTIEWVLNGFGLTVNDLEGELHGLDPDQLGSLQVRSSLWSGKPAGGHTPAPDEIFYWSDQTPSQAMASILATLPPTEEPADIWTKEIDEGFDLFAPEGAEGSADWLPDAESWLPGADPDSPPRSSADSDFQSGAADTGLHAIDDPDRLLSHEVDLAAGSESDWALTPESEWGRTPEPYSTGPETQQGSLDDSEWAVSSLSEPASAGHADVESPTSPPPDWMRTPEPDWLTAGEPDWPGAGQGWLDTPEPDWASPPGGSRMPDVSPVAPVAGAREEARPVPAGGEFQDEIDDVFLGPPISPAADAGPVPGREELPLLPAPLEGALDRQHGPTGAGDLYNQACLLRDLGDLVGARDMFQQALDADEAALGPHHPAVANDLSGLGIVLRDLGDLEGAKAALERAVAINEEARGSDNASLSTDLSDLGGVLRDLGDLNGARVALERAVAIDQRVLGRDHPTLSTDLNTLAGVLSSLGDLPEARRALEQALAIDEGAYGKDHPKVATRLNNLGNVLRSQSDLFGAKACLDRALSITESSLGPDHPKVATRLGNLGNVLKDLGDPFAARPNLERALAIDEATYGRDHPRVASRLAALAGVLQAIGNVQAAKDHMERAVAITEAVYGKDHPKLEARRRQLNGLAARGDTTSQNADSEAPRRHHKGPPGGIIRISSLIGR
jgi:tetratricopeptide (TPR) repeat protein